MTSTTTRPRLRSSSTRSFVRHYVEMLVGMFAFGIPLAALLTAAGIDVEGWHTAAGVTAAMFLPSFGAIALLVSRGLRLI